MKKKIAILAPGILPIPVSRGGAVETLMQILIDQNEKEKLYDFTIYSYMNEESLQLSMKYKNTKFVFYKRHDHFDRINLFIYKVLRKFSVSIPEMYMRWKAFRDIEKNNYDVALFEAGETFSFLNLKRRLKNTKLLVHAHWDPKFFEVYNNKFDMYIGVSDYITDKWKNASYMTTENFATWHNQIDTSKFKKDIDENELLNLKNSLEIKDEIVCLYTGRMIEEKGIYELLEAFEHLNNSYKLLVIGSAKFAEKTLTSFEKKINELIEKNKNKIVFTGYIDNAELYKFYKLADISIIPSIFEEPAGLVVMEAMTSGKPLITTATGGMKEYLCDGGYLLVDKNNLTKELEKAIRKLGESEELRLQMSEINLIASEQFKKENYLRDFSAIVESL